MSDILHLWQTEIVKKTSRNWLKPEKKTVNAGCAQYASAPLVLCSWKGQWIWRVGV